MRRFLACRDNSFKRLLQSGVAALGAATLFSAPVHAEQRFMAYYPSWRARLDPEKNIDPRLAGVASGVDILALAFMKPNASYDGKSLDGTGLEMSYDAAVLKSSIKQLKRANPRVKVLVSVGGAAYSDWGCLDARSIAQFVRNIGLDGVDIDFEPNAPQCRATEAGVACDSDAILRSAVTALRNALPRPAVLSIALANVGAYGEGDWRSAAPRGSATYGVDLALLRDEALINSLDFVSIMAYDAGSTYSPLEAFRAVRHYYKGPVLIGFTPPPEAWGGHRYSAYEVREVLQKALKDKAAGAMLFSIGKGGQEPPSLENPDATILIDTITDVLRRKD